MQIQNMMKLRTKFSSKEINGFLDEGISVTGEIECSGTLRLDGQFSGLISGADHLIVGKYARIQADIRVGELEVYGSVYGTVKTTLRIIIHSGGNILGDIQSPALVIEEGGKLEGNSNMLDQEAAEIPVEKPRASKREWRPKS